MKKNEYMEELKRMANEDMPTETATEEIENEQGEQTARMIDKTGSKKYSITIQVKDMQRFVLRHMYGGFSGWFGVAISVIALVMVIIGWSKYGNFEKIALIILASLFTVVQPIQLMMKAKRQVMSQEMYKIPLIYNICKDGIAVSQGEMEASVLWDEIFKVKENSKAIYVYTSPVRAFIFPKNQLGDVNEFKSLIKR